MLPSSVSRDANEIRIHLVDLLLDLLAQLSLQGKGLSRDMTTPEAAIDHAERVAVAGLQDYQRDAGAVHIEGLLNALKQIHETVQRYRCKQYDAQGTLTMIEKTAYGAIRGIYPKRSQIE